MKMKEKKELRIGSVGTSSIMNVMQEAVRLTAGVRCTAVFSRDEQRGKDYAQKVGAAHSFSDFETFISQEDLDIIYLASPNDCHVEQACKALGRGKHVIVEKPASLDRAGIRRLDQAARENRVFWFEAITTLFMPNYLICRELLPRLGKITRAEFSYGQYSSKYDDYLKGKAASSLSPEHGGGALNDMGVYCIHPVIELFGMPDEIRFEPVRGFNGVDVESTCFFIYRDPELTCVLHAAKNRDIGSGTVIEGENGVFTQEGPMNDFRNINVRFFQNEKKDSGILPDDAPVDLQHGENRMIYELAAFRDAILSHDEAFYEKMMFQSLRVAGILEDIVR